MRQDFIGLYNTCLELDLVELGGVEPPSGIPLPLVLHV